MRTLQSVTDMRICARRRLPKFVFDFVDGGSLHEAALRRNIEALESTCLVARTLKGNESRSSNTVLFGHTYRAPFGIAPMGMAGLVWPGADEALASSAHEANLPYVLSTASNCTLEDVSQVSAATWFQLYCGKDPAIYQDLLARAANVGVQNLVVTVDLAAPGKRLRDLRNDFALPFRQTARFTADVLSHPSWLVRLACNGSPRLANLTPYNLGKSDPKSLAQLMTEQSSAQLDWKTIETLRRKWPGPLILKGIMHPEDARLAINSGVDAVWVSNHGGRQIDASPAPAQMLPILRDYIGSDFPLLCDGGVRAGEDIAKLLALGADFVFIGRPFLYALAAGGPDRGPGMLIHLLLDEFDRAMAQLGATSCDDLVADLLWQNICTRSPRLETLPTHAFSAT